MIEGFYGRPWTWDERRAVMDWCHARGMTHYVYAPKDDPLHRDRWRDPYPEEDLEGFAGLVGAGTLRVTFAVSPGLSIDEQSASDRAALAAKIDQVVATGVRDVVLALDDIPVSPGQGARHGELTAWLADHLGGRAELAVVPTDYTSCRPTPYLSDFASACPTGIPIAWTGPRVVCDEITVDDARRRADALGGRPPLVWDNYPVNDLLMRDRLFLGPLRGRDPGLLAATEGWLANPMIQPNASLLPLASVAAFVRGDDPLRAWQDEADRIGLRHFADACDGARPVELADRVVAALDGRGGDLDEHLRGLRAWLAELLDWVAEQAPTIDWVEQEVADWVEQSRAEAEVCMKALGTIEMLTGSGERAQHGADLAAASAAALGLLVRWQTLPRSQVSSFGPRRSLQPSMSQDDDGHWRVHDSMLVDGPNATDRLVTAVLGLLAG